MIKKSLILGMSFFLGTSSVPAMASVNQPEASKLAATVIMPSKPSNNETTEAQSEDSLETSNAAQTPQLPVSFSDVPLSHWSYNTIQWAIDNGVVIGYSDGTFKPNNEVTEMEFISMLTRTYKLTISSKEAGAPWYDSYFWLSYSNGWLNHSSTSKYKDKPITRYWAATVMSRALTKNYFGNGSIHYIMDLGIANGVTDRSISGFKGAETLTRAEAVTLLRNMKSKVTVKTRADMKESESYYNPIPEEAEWYYNPDSTIPHQWEEFIPLGSSDRKGSAKLIFSKLKWDNDTHKATFTVPTVQQIKALGGYFENAIDIRAGVYKASQNFLSWKRVTSMEPGKSYSVTDFPDVFSIQVEIIGDGSIMDSYSVYNYSTFKNKYKRVLNLPEIPTLTDDLIVKDTFYNNDEMSTLNAIHRALKNF